MAVNVCVDDRIRVTASALLLTRFSSYRSEVKSHPLKARVLAHVTPLRNHPFIELVNKLSSQWWMHVFYSTAVLLETDDFGFRIPPDPYVPDRMPELAQQIMQLRVQRYDELMSQFYEDSRLERFWEDTSDLWEQVITDCETLLGHAKVEEFLSELHGPITRHLTIVPNPLDPAGFGFGTSNAESLFTIVGPPEIPHSDSREVRYAEWGTTLATMAIHEFSHSLLARAGDNLSKLIEATKHLAEQMAPRGYFTQSYPDWASQLEEILIRAIEALYLLESEGASAAESRLAQQESWYGITLIRPVFQSLNAYLVERRRGKYGGLADFIPDLANEMAGW